jgi:predicted acyl esterase
LQEDPNPGVPVAAMTIGNYMCRKQVSVSALGEKPMWTRRRCPIELCELFIAFVFIAGIVGPSMAGDDLPEFEASDSLVPMSDGIELATTVYRPRERGRSR